MEEMNRLLLEWLRSDQGTEALALVTRGLSDIVIRGQSDATPDVVALAVQDLIANAANILGNAGIEIGTTGDILTPVQRQETVDPAGTFRSWSLENNPALGGLSRPFREAAMGPQVSSDALSRYFIAQMGNPNLSFRDFLGGPRQSTGKMGASLNTITDLLGTEDAPEARGISQFLGNRPRQFGAAIQPLLQGMSPILRSGFRSWARNLYDEWTDLNPDQEFLPFARERRFF
jgi:hypothetical protein